MLTALSGAYVSAAGTASAPTSLTAVDALVQLLDYRNETGMVCNSVQDIAAVYELQSGPSAALQLVAKWQITADAYQYYVDCATGDGRPGLSGRRPLSFRPFSISADFFGIYY